MIVWSGSGSVALDTPMHFRNVQYVFLMLVDVLACDKTIANVVLGI
jgi:hypothetical protein